MLPAQQNQQSTTESNHQPNLRAKPQSFSDWRALLVAKKSQFEFTSLDMYYQRSDNRSRIRQASTR